jgi:hypothetical protein
MRIRWLWWAVLWMVGLGACTPQAATVPVLPIASDRPTLLFFYTDG